MHLTDVHVSPEDQLPLEIITYIGCGISFIALTAAIIIFLSLRSLTDIKYQIHLHLCIALAMAQVVFLTGITATEKQWLCKLVAVLLHFLYTASFTWMSAEGLHLYFKIVTVFNLERIKMIYYVIFCWGE
ncbi:putative adhesion G protein-coupled receptor E4P [Orbicella faveolata]|uniref:putative adhesion G protein-coupled receptor E4P n=1 Tax=Orbicella faveolata TaxID=48498 RepID=UPI0009E19E8D|nr:putative adhesion G protein-coupled receptor E4P [Orbicella faveolata]